MFAERAVNPHCGTHCANGVALLRGRRSSLMSIVVGEPALRAGLAGTNQLASWYA
jgi:hypothetical protein